MTDILSYDGFKNVILSQVRKAFAEDKGISDIYISKTVKNNDSILETLVIRTEADRCLPCMHIKDLYSAYEEGNLNVEEMAEGIRDMFYTYADPALPSGEEFLELIEDFDNVRDHIGCRLVNGETNRKRLEACPHKRIGEFAVTYYIRVGEVRNGFYVMQISNDVFGKWGISIDEMHDLAMKNMDFSNSFEFRNMSEMLGPQGHMCRMFILTNKGTVNGAAVILSAEVRRKVSEYMNGDYYILPSSVHELIIIPCGRGDTSAELSRMVREVNRTQYVKSEEFLSDNVYEYCAEEDMVKLAVTGERVA